MLSSGLMFASVAWMEVAGALLGGVMQNAVFAATVGWMKSFVFMVDAVIYLLVALLSMYVILSNTFCTQLKFFAILFLGESRF